MYLFSGAVMKWERPYNTVLEQVLYALLGIAAGAGIGAVVGIFGRGVLFFSDIGMQNFSLYVWFMPLAGLFTVAMLKRWGKKGIGMDAAFAASRGEGGALPLRGALFQFAGTWSAHLFCASVGREGAAMQIGAALGENIGRAVPLRGAPRTMLVAGMAAGFSALFGTPVCALFFALEVTVVGGLRLHALTASAFASFAAYFVASLCGLAPYAPAVGIAVQFTLGSALRVFALGAACGLAGLAFCLIRRFSARFFAACMPNAYLRVLLAGAMLACLLYLSGGRYAGLGTNLVQAAAEGGTVYAWDWIVKILFTAITLSVGFLGGEVTTFFAAGACLGSALGGALGLPPAAAACIGYAALFGAATNTLIAPVFLCAELFGAAFLPFAAVACIAAYLFNFGHSVYPQRLREGVVRPFPRLRREERRLPLSGPLYGRARLPRRGQTH